MAPALRVALGLTALLSMGALAQVADAHILLELPTPRSANSSIKAGPCGPDVKGEPLTTYTAGATVDVSWQEVINHRGCFQLAIAKDGDQSEFTTLVQLDDPNDMAGDRTHTFKLPDDLTCENCTFQLRQLMINRACDAEQSLAGLGAGAVYYHCADVRIIAAETPAVDAGTGSSSGAATSSGGAPPPAIDAGADSGPAEGVGASDGRLPSVAPPEAGGCNTQASTATPGVAALLATAWLLRRRRRVT